MQNKVKIRYNQDVRGSEITINDVRIYTKDIMVSHKVGLPPEITISFHAGELEIEMKETKL